MGSRKQTGSVTGWIADLKEGDEGAAQRILERYFEQIVAAARRRIGVGTLRVADEEDVAIEAFESLFKAAAAGRLGSLRNRHDLWGLLVTTSYRKVCDYWRRQVAQKRGGKVVDGESPSARRASRARLALGLDELAVEKASAEFLAAIADQHRFLMEKLRVKGNQLPEIATMILQGYTNREVAQRLECSESRIERKRRLIRDLWKHAVGEPP